MSRYADDDPYTYPGSPVLRSIPGLRDEAALREFEAACGIRRILQGVPESAFDYAHLKAIHKHIFQDVYDWAGQDRNVPVN